MKHDLRLQSFTKWLRDPVQEVVLHPSVEICSHAPEPGYGVFSSSVISEDAVLFHIPKTCILSIRTCAIANILENSDIDGMLGVCLAYMYERFLGHLSPWHPYINICPRSVPISKSWNTAEQRILKGTEVAMVGGTSLSDFKEMYHSEVRPFLDRHATELGSFSQMSFAEFCKGMSVVGSRAFEVDAYHGLAMCPFADMLDHKIDEHVHFQTTYDVCPDCGEASGCVHDPSASDNESVMSQSEHSDCSSCSHHSDDRNSGILDDSDGSQESSEEPDVCEFVVHRQIGAREQIMNTYGDCGNDVLLARYGFALLDNPHDRISLGPEISALTHEYWDWWSLNGNNLMGALQKISTERQSSDSSDSSEDTKGAQDIDEDSEFEDLCYLEYSGRPSSSLLHYLLLCTIPMSTLQTKSGPEIKAHFEVLLAAFRYVQPGRMPLPRYLFTEALHNVLAVASTLKLAVTKRMGRYKSHTDEFNIDMDQASVDSLVQALRSMCGLGPQQSRLRYATIVRINELGIMQRCMQYLKNLESTTHWLFERD